MNIVYGVTSGYTKRLLTLVTAYLSGAKLQMTIHILLRNPNKYTFVIHILK